MEAFRSGSISPGRGWRSPGRVGRHRSSIGSGMIMFNQIVIVIARSNSDEAIQLPFFSHLDCIAELVIGPAISGRTRWLAMTIGPVKPKSSRFRLLHSCEMPPQ